MTLLEAETSPIDAEASIDTDIAPDAAAVLEPPRKKRRWLRWLGVVALLFVITAIVVRAFLPSTIIWYVNRILDENPLYDGKIDDIDLHLYRGAYTIKKVRLVKTTGNVPVPLFAAESVDLAISWDGLRHGKLVGTVLMKQPELNFVDDPRGSDGGNDQTGVDGPWLAMLNDLFPFTINRVVVNDGSIHFSTYPVGEKPVDIYLSQVQATVDNLTNIQDEVTPLVTTVTATALAMDTAKFEYQMKLDPFSYKPTFHLMTRLLNLDVTKLNDLTRTYGSFDFQRGWFDLVIELDAKEGYLKGYVKPLFRNLRIFTVEDIEQDNILQVFWEALVGGGQQLLKNQGRDQFGTLIPFSGQVDGPKPSILDTIGNVLRNGFIRAYLPKLQNGIDPDMDGLKFDPPSLTDPVSFNDESISACINQGQIA